MSPAACVEERYTTSDDPSEWERPDMPVVPPPTNRGKGWHSGDNTRSSDDLRGWFRDSSPKAWRVYLNRPKPIPVAETGIDKIKFSRLTEEWHEETDMHSSTLKAIAHPAYLTIIAMGQKAIPLVLREMKRGPGHWFPAIKALTEGLRAKDEDPSKGCTTASEARAAWVRWGESRGYL